MSEYADNGQNPPSEMTFQGEVNSFNILYRNNIHISTRWVSGMADDQCMYGIGDDLVGKACHGFWGNDTKSARFAYPNKASESGKMGRSRLSIGEFGVISSSRVVSGSSKVTVGGNPR